MSISVNLKKIFNLPGQTDRKVELSFRGFTHKTRILHCANVAIFNEYFRWPHYGKGIGDEVLSVRVYNSSKVFSNRLLGQLVVSLQHVVTSGRMVLREPLADANYSLTDIFIELDIRYHPIEGAAGPWDGLDFLKDQEKDESALVIRNKAFDGPDESSVKPRTRPDHREREARRLGHSLSPLGEDDDDDDDYYDDDLDLDIIFTSLLSRSRPLTRSAVAGMPRVKSFQVNLTIQEAQKLAGVNINPAVFVRLGGQKRNTGTQKSTNCPFFNENFQFEFQECSEVFFDKVIEIKVVHRGLLPFLMTHIGTFKIDISTVYNQPDHRFYQKWAPLTDPADTRSGVKGYVKATINVLMKGDALVMPSLSAPSSSGAAEDIERNLLLPRGMPSERPWARFRIRIYRAEGLPTMGAGLMAKMSVSDRAVFIDPYVQVAFAGQQGETSIASATNCPVWNEEISFIEQFPPLAQRIKVQILDDTKMGDIALATHFLDLQQISDPTRNGFNPTFGPSWVNLYGSPQNSTLGDVHQALNEGLGEGIFYRGRILLALSMEVYSSPAALNTDSGSGAAGKMKGALGKLGLKKKNSSKDKNRGGGGADDDSGEAGEEVPEMVTVEVEETHPLPEGFLGQKEEFLLFASLFEVTMMDPSVGTKPLSFELSIGNNGKVVEVGKSKKAQSKEDLRRSREDLNEETHILLESEDELEMQNPEPENRSLSAAMRPQSTEYDGSFKCFQLQPPAVKLKPCLYVWTQFEDHCFRLYLVNLLSKMADRLEIGLNEVEILLRRPRSKVKERLVEVLLELVASCRQFSAFSDKRSQCRPNSLDKSRKEFIKKKLVLVARQAIRARRRLTRKTTKQRLIDSRKLLKSLRQLATEPQSTIPDAFLWLLSGNKRLAYVRIPAHSIVFSLVEEQRGRDCGKITTLYMKSPGGSTIEIFAKLEVYLWLGNIKYSKDVINGLPEEFMPVFEEELEEQRRPGSTDRKRKLPVSLSCQDSRYFQLRCHLYQGRGLLAADDDGLSDPFAKVIFSTQCQRTRVLSDTVSPAWCECLLFDRVLLEGTREQLEEDPPLIIINVYDYDSVGRPKPLGRAFAEPEFKTVDKLYQRPRLRFFDISLGRVPAGELLAAFELIELDYSGFGEPCLPSSVEPQKLTYMEEQKYYIIPDGVRPVLKTFRIEVLFWGVRDLKRVQLFEVERPLVRVECAGKQLESEEMESYKAHPNFKEVVGYIDVELPEQSYLHPPLTVFVVEHRAFGQLALVGSYVVQSLMDYGPRVEEEPDEEEEKPKPNVKQNTPKANPLTSMKNMKLTSLSVTQSVIPINPLKLVNGHFQKLKKKIEELEEDAPEKAELDWWSKYYASVEELEKLAAEQQEKEEQGENDAGNLSMGNIDEEEEEEEEIVVVEVEPPKRKKIATLKLFPGDLESEFRQFQDWLKIFPLQKGKANFNDDDDDDEEKIMGKYKGSFMVYPIDPEDTENLKCEITNGIPRNSPIKVLVRIYIVKATNLAPSDSNGKADPYLVIQVGEQSLDSKDRYIPKQLNPTFGEVFELTVSFPLETELQIKVMDHNFVGSDDVIGETRVDLENRFYSRHRAACGLALYYDTDGYNEWRDAKRPSAILAELCKENGIPSPEYRASVVKVLNKIFKIPPDAVPEALLKKNKRSEDEETEMEEHSALSVLQRWAEMNEFLPGALPLVPEHVEVRSLLHPDSPGLPQGYLHMWVDMFPTDVPAPPTVDIKPRLPEQYELRVIIWNTDDVVLEDVNPFTGNPSSDIYVKGWIKGREDKKQETDVHFNSLTGEGNFNWRFIFRFDYLPTEKEVVYKKKESFFSLEESEFRQPAVLTLQVWDYDRIGSNDFLGSIDLRLNDMVRPAKASSKCSIKMAKDRASPRFSIFRAKKMKGWWPLIRQKTAKDFEREEKEKEEAMKKGGKKKKKRKDKRSKLKLEDIQYTDSLGNTFLLMGKVEAELQLLPLDQAEANPVGKARKEPEPLDKPNRPTTTFTWFVNPMKTFVHLIWKKFKKYIISLAILTILSVFLALMVYTLPQQITALIIKG